MSSLARFAGPKPPTRSSPASTDFVDESQTHETRAPLPNGAIFGGMQVGGDGRQGAERSRKLMKCASPQITEAEALVGTVVDIYQRNTRQRARPHRLGAHAMASRCQRAAQINDSARRARF